LHVLNICGGLQHMMLHCYYNCCSCCFKMHCLLFCDQVLPIWTRTTSSWKALEHSVDCRRTQTLNCATCLWRTDFLTNYEARKSWSMLLTLVI